MKNLNVMVVSNTSVFASAEEFMNSQDEMKNPMIIVMDQENKVLDYYWIEAENAKELALMLEKKLFFTSSIPVDTTLNKYGAIFVGYPKGYFQSAEWLQDDEEINENSVLLQQNAI